MHKYTRWGIFGAIGFFGVLVAVNSCATVPAGHIGVVTTFGAVSEDALKPGAHLINPLSVVTPMDCRMQRDSRDQRAASKDMQDVKVSLGLNYHLNPASAVRIFKEVGPEWSDRVIPNAESETLKAEIAHHVASDILQNRVQIKANVEKTLAVWLTKYGIDLDEVSISNINFSEEYEKAIERKQVQEQTALQRVYELQTAQKDAEIAKAKAAGEAQAAIEKARGDAESVTIRAEAQAIANKKLGESLSGETGERVVLVQQIEKWNGILPGVVAKDGSIFIGVK